MKMAATTDMTTLLSNVDSTTVSGQLDEQTVLVLAVSIPAAVFIISLVIIILIIFGLMVKKSGNEEEIEAMYIRRRFQGLSLEEQTKLQKKKRNKSVSRKGSGASKVSINTRNGRIRSVNPFGLQDWQLKLSGIEVDIDTEETDLDGDEETGRRTVGAINPLMVQGIQDYEPAKRQPSKKPSQAHTRPQAQRRIPLADRQPQESPDSDSSDSFNPYD